MGSTRCRSDCGVTVAEIEMNSTLIMSCTRVSKNGRRAGMSKLRILASARPMKIAATSPVSSRSLLSPAGRRWSTVHGPVHVPLAHILNVAKPEAGIITRNR